MDSQRLRKLVERSWSTGVLPVLTEYIRIPNKSPTFDPEWQAHGHIDRAVDLVAEFCRSRKISGLSLEVVRLPGRTPLLFMEIPGTAPDADGAVLLYGQLGERFPAAQFVITGVLGPESNAHGPNEFLHIPTAKKLTACVAQVLAGHAAQA
jgi:hypothetical protein